MSDHDWVKTAVDTAAKEYRIFLDKVLEDHVVRDRETIPLSKATKDRLDKGLIVHPSPIRLFTISGKGGASGVGEGRNNYAQYFNVTLLDHLLSTVRGSLVAYALKSLQANPAMNPEVLRPKLRAVAAVAFLHDLDKDQGLPRNTPLTETVVQDAMVRYGIKPFLVEVGVCLDPDQMRYLIENVESTQSYQHLPKTPVPRVFESLPLTVRDIDQLDGVWYLDDSEKGGLTGLIQRLSSGDIFPGKWKPVRLFDPHHPFLLDELQRHLSRSSIRTAHLPPLIEVHRDGELFMLLPEQQYDAIVQNAVQNLCAGLPFDLEVVVSNRGVPSLFNGSPTHDELAMFVQKKMEEKTLLDLFKVSTSIVEDSFKKDLDHLLENLGLQPRWPKNPTTALIRLYSSLEGIEGGSMEWLHRAAHLILLLNLKVDAPPKKAVPSYENREKGLLELTESSRPEWISSVQLKEPDPSRRILTALWVTALSKEKQDLYQKVWGDDGILKCWLEGMGETPGFRDFITGRGSEVRNGLKRRLLQLLNGQRVAPVAEYETGRCLFTDEPVPFEQSIKDADGLYGVRVSAFSGREGRPELLTSESAHTNVSASSMAEHRKKAEVHKQQGGVDEGVPTLVSSPTTSGLFGGLALAEDKAMSAMSIYDLCRSEVKKGRVISGHEIYRLRYRIARLELMPERLAKQLDKIHLFLKACRRVGRPIHIFRGLPLSQRAFFHYDAMPRPIADLLGGASLRLEQIPDALKRLETAHMLLKTNSLGYEAFRRYANPKTRFGAICLAWGELRSEKNKKNQPGEIISRLTEEYLEQMGGNNMNETEGALVKFGRAAAGIQGRPGPGASANEELMVFKIAMDTVTAARRTQQTDETSLIYAVAGELETNLSRRDKTWLSQPEAIRKRCLTVAEVFVRDVWFGALKGRPPAQNDRRVLASIYRMAFVTVHRKS